MSRQIDDNLINIGIDDFGVSALVQDLTYEQLKLLREMIIVAIWAAEDMWRRHQNEKASEEQKSSDHEHRWLTPLNEDGSEAGTFCEKCGLIKR